MKFNGEILIRMAVTDKRKDEPDEFVIVTNPKNSAGIIPYARYGESWTTTVPARTIIRCLALALKNKGRLYIDHVEGE